MLESHHLISSLLRQSLFLVRVTIEGATVV